MECLCTARETWSPTDTPTHPFRDLEGASGLWRGHLALPAVQEMGAGRGFGTTGTYAPLKRRQSPKSVVPAETGTGLLSSGTGHSVTQTLLSHLAVCFVSYQEWLALPRPCWHSGASLWSPSHQGDCQKKATNVCFSDRHRNRAGAGVWEGGGSEEAMCVPGTTACPFIWIKSDPPLPLLKGKTWSGHVLCT